jgi:hypothetical protein
MSARSKAELSLVVLAALVVVGGFIDRIGGGGFERSYFAYVILLLGPGFWLWLVARGRSDPLPGLGLGLAIFAFCGFTARPFGPWGLTLAAFANFWLALAEMGDAAKSPATTIDEALVVALGAASYSLLWLVADGDVKNYVIAGLLALLAIEAWRRGANRTIGAARRRVCAIALLSASSMMYHHIRPDPIFIEPENLFLVLGATAVLTGCVEAG